MTVLATNWIKNPRAVNNAALMTGTLGSGQTSQTITLTSVTDGPTGTPQFAGNFSGVVTGGTKFPAISTNPVSGGGVLPIASVTDSVFASGWIKAGSLPGGASWTTGIASLRLTNASNGFLTTIAGTAVTLVVGTWVYVEVRKTLAQILAAAPTTANIGIQLNAQLSPNTVDGTYVFRWARPMLMPLAAADPAPTYVDGSLSNCAWTGTADASSSQRSTADAACSLSAGSTLTAVSSVERRASCNLAAGVSLDASGQAIRPRGARATTQQGLKTRAVVARRLKTAAMTEIS